MPRALKTMAEHLLHGSVPQNKLPAVSEIPVGRPTYPKTLSKAGRRIFKALCALLEERRTLTKADGEALRLYAVIYDRQLRAQEHLESEGEVVANTRLDSSGMPHQVYKQNLWLGIAERCEKNLCAILIQLGLTPAAKTRTRPAPVEKPVDALEELMTRRRPARFQPTMNEESDDLLVS